MYTAIEGTYENGELTLSEVPPTRQKSKVVVLFMDESVVTSPVGVRLGSLAGKYQIPDDFNAPLDDLADYM